MTTEDLLLEELDRNHRKRTRRERWLAVWILILGLVVAAIVSYEITAADNSVNAIRCEQGDVVLIIERAGGVSERVECPAGASVKP
jgi:hypothetical protein